MNAEQTVYIFDFDGVFNDLSNEDADPRIINQIVKLLNNNVFVAINTGRGYSTLRNGIALNIKSQLENPCAMDKFFIACEMGGIGIEYANGDEKKKNSAFSLTSDEIEQVRELYENDAQAVSILEWEPKESMATLKKRQNTTVDAMAEARRTVVNTLQSNLANQPILVTDNNSAIDIHTQEAGKRAGAQLIYEWLRRTTDIKHDHFICFGDNLIDYDMSLFFAEQSHNATFVFSGKHFEGEINPLVNFVKTDPPYNEGVYSYLSTHFEK